MTGDRIASVVLDVDSTLCGVEGIDWLADRRGGDVSRRVRDLTDRAMRGDIALDAVYGERLAMVEPRIADVEALAKTYIDTIAPGAREVIHRLTSSKRRVVLVSGGIREAILPAAKMLGILERDVHAVSLRFGPDGSMSGFDRASPLATAAGKGQVVQSLRLSPRVLAVGDGMTDLAMRPVVDVFAAFTGFVFREPVVAGADLILESFDHLAEYVLR